ncbi:MAG: hypothetical protein IKS21_05745 [Oscillospiraceae bacterium]|nr:hypothetical protein [Oscillospiraceae bacterium]
MRKALALLMAVLLLGSLATAVFANNSPTNNPSPTGTPEIIVEIYYHYDPQNPEYGGTVVLHEGDEYIITPKEKDGYEYTHYEFEGEYEVVSKDGSTWVIRPLTDLVIHVFYKGGNEIPSDSSGSSTPTKPTGHDPNPDSPPTGDNTAMILVIMLVGLCGVVLAIRKIIRNH